MIFTNALAYLTLISPLIKSTLFGHQAFEIAKIDVGLDFGFIDAPFEANNVGLVFIVAPAVSSQPIIGFVHGIAIHEIKKVNKFLFKLISVNIINMYMIS